MTIVMYFQHVPFCSEANNSIDSNLCTLYLQLVWWLVRAKKPANSWYVEHASYQWSQSLVATSEIILAFYWCHMLPSCMSEYMLKLNYCAVGNTTCMLLYLVAQLE